MFRKARYQHRIEMLQGTLDLVVLQTLRSGPQHGYAISQAIADGSADLFQIDTGSLYPALHRLEQRGWVKSAWRVSEHKQRAKYYQLTAAGKRQLSSERARWQDFVGAMSGILRSRKREASS